MAVYLTPAKLLEYYDRRRVLQVASDTDQPITDLPTNPNILTAIRSASAELDSALQVGRRYQRQTVEDVIDAADAAEVTQPTTDAGRAEKERAITRASKIREIVAHLTFYRLIARRGFAAGSVEDLAPSYGRAQKMIDDLSSGVAVLDLDANIGAGVPQVVTLNRQGKSLYAGMRMFPYDAAPGPNGYYC